MSEYAKIEDGELVPYIGEPMSEAEMFALGFKHYVLNDTGYPEGEPSGKYLGYHALSEDKTTVTDTIEWRLNEEWRPIQPVPPEPEPPEPPTPEPKKPTVDDYNRAMETKLFATRVARGYDTREPSDYLFSEDKRWKQDAVDWIKYRDAVMHYGQDIMNHYAETGEAPSLEEFAANMPHIEWTYKMGVK